MRCAAALAVASVAATAGCHAAPQRVLSVHEVIGNIDGLNGNTVRVGGYLPQCGGYECILYASQADAARANAWFAMAAKEHKKPPFEPPEFVSIGADPDFNFDHEAAPLVGHYVVITGKVDNRCRYHGEWGCTDRGPDIHPKGIAAWQPPSAAGGTMEKKV